MDKPTRIVLGTRNKGKAKELVDHLGHLGIDLLTLADFEAVPEVVEDGETFIANARKKAITIATHLHEWALGEDSGLSVDALKGNPGVFSARYSGPDATDESNNAKLISELDGKPAEKRNAHYTCTAALSDPNGQIHLEVEGLCSGRILSEPVGEEGFGYDPLFLIPEYHKTFAQLGLPVKRHLSHRARAIRQLVLGIKRLFVNESISNE